MLLSLLFLTLLPSPQPVHISEAANSCQNLLDTEFSHSLSGIDMRLCDQKRVLKVSADLTKDLTSAGKSYVRIINLAAFVEMCYNLTSAPFNNLMHFLPIGVINQM